MSRIILWAVGFLILLGMLIAACGALVNDEDSLGRVVLINHEYECQNHDGCGDEEEGRRDKKTCFFGCDNIIIVPGLPGQEQPPPEERVSLVPPTPDKIIAGIQTMADAGIELGSSIARLTVNYVITVFRFIV